MKISVTAAIAMGLMGAMSTAAQADNAQTSDGTLTWYGVTLYGTIDAGIQYQNSGAPQSDYFGPGTLALVSKQSSSSQTSVLMRPARRSVTIPLSLRVQKLARAATSPALSSIPKPSASMTPRPT